MKPTSNPRSPARCHKVQQDASRKPEKEFAEFTQEFNKKYILMLRIMIQTERNTEKGTAAALAANVDDFADDETQTASQRKTRPTPLASHVFPPHWLRCRGSARYMCSSLAHLLFIARWSKQGRSSVFVVDHSGEAVLSNRVACFEVKNANTESRSEIQKKK